MSTNQNFDESWFDPNLITQQYQTSSTNTQNTSQGNITNDLIDTVTPSQAYSFPHQTSQSSLSHSVVDNLIDIPEPAYQFPSHPQSSTQNAMPSYIDTPYAHDKSPHQKGSHYNVSLKQNQALANSPTREALSGIHAFFNSRELPPNLKQISLADIPQGSDAVPFVFQNKCYYQGIGIFDQYMKSAPSQEERMYYKILKLMCLVKLAMWDEVASEFSSLGNLDKMIMESKHDIYLPYQLRLIYALTPFLSSPLQQKMTSSSAVKVVDDKTLDRLFCLYYFCENKINEANENDLYQDENIDMFTICDADISPQQWMARLFRTTLLILEILLYKSATRTANEFIKNALQKFPRNDILMAYLIRIKQLQGDYSEAKFFLDKINEKLPKDEHLEFISFNNCIQRAYELKASEAKELLIELAQKFPQYSTLAYNNLAYIYVTEGQILKAMEILEDTIRTEPWNINEVIVLNLLHLYDFYYVDNKSKKRIIEEIVDQYAMNFNKSTIAHELRS